MDVWECSQRPEGGIRSPRAGVTSDCKLPSMDAGTQHRPLRAMHALNHWAISSDPILQFKKCFIIILCEPVHGAIRGESVPRPSCGGSSLLQYLHGFQGFNSGHQACTENAYIRWAISPDLFCNFEWVILSSEGTLWDLSWQHGSPQETCIWFPRDQPLGSI